SGVAWQQLGTTYQVLKSSVIPPSGIAPTTGMLRVTLGNNAQGVVAADGVRLVRVSPAVASLKALTLDGNPLNNDAQVAFAGLLDQIDNSDTSAGVEH